MISNEFPLVNLLIMLIFVLMLVMIMTMDLISLMSSENCRIFSNVVNSGSFRKYSWYWKSAERLERVLAAALSSCASSGSFESNVCISNFIFISEAYWWKFWAEERFERAKMLWVKVDLSLELKEASKISITPFWMSNCWYFGFHEMFARNLHDWWNVGLKKRKIWRKFTWNYPLYCLALAQIIGKLN